MELVQKEENFELYKEIIYKVFIDGKEISLTPTEHKLLKILASNQGSLVPHKTLLDSVWNYSEGNDILRVNMANLRHKIGRIKTVKGKGYIFT